MRSLEEKVSQDNRKGRDSWFIPIIGIVISLIGYIIYDFHINTYLTTQTGREVLLSAEYPYQLLGLLLIIVGIIMISLGIGKKIYSGI